MSRFLSREETEQLCDRVLSWSKADGCRVSYNGNWSGNTRFAANQMTTSGSVEDGTVAVQSAFGKKVSAATTNTFTDEALRATLEQSERLAQLAPENPEYMPELPVQHYAAVNGFFDGTANLDAGARALAAKEAIDLSLDAGDLVAAGFIQVGAGAQAVANSNGMFAYWESTNANYTLTVRTTDGTGSGWAGSSHPDWSHINTADIARRASQKASASRSPVGIEPGRYTVVMEPQATGDLVQLLQFALNARQSDEGRGAFTKEGGGNKIGEKIVDERITVFSDPTDPDMRTAPFDGNGFPLGREVWIENGVLNNLIYTRFWADKQEKRPTGFPNSGKMVGGSGSVDDLVGGTERGILVTRLWYLRQVDPRTMMYTGLTRDGTFLIEDGQISRSIKNFRFNDSPLFLLNNLDAMAQSERLGGTEAGGAVIIPAIRARDFNFTSLSDAV